MCKQFRVLFSGLIFVSFAFLHAEGTQHPFEVESGMILYDIRGGAQLTPETNLSIAGNAKLRFKEWGEVKIEEMNGVVVTKGAIQHQESIKRFQKETKDTIITADFANKQLLERKKSSIKKDIQSIQTDHLEQKGTEIIAGLVCDVWEGKNIQKCIYKGIVLKLESHVYDVSYVKIATEVVSDINTSEDCAVPDYPIQEFGLFRGNIKTKNSAESKDFCKVINDVIVNVNEHNESYVASNFEDPKRKEFINRIGQDIFEKQQELLAQLLEAMKTMRVCLQTVENTIEANVCMENFSDIKSKLGNNESNYIIFWDEKRKNVLLDKIEDDIIELESRIACVKRAKNITDLSVCMK